MLGFNDIDAATAVASGLLGLVAGVILGPVFDRKFFEKGRHRRVEAELDRLKVLLNKRRNEVDLEERRLSELQEEAAWLRDIRAETELWTDRLNSVRVEVGNIDRNVRDLTDIGAELAHCHQQRTAIKAEIQALPPQEPLKKPMPPPKTGPKAAESKTINHAKQKPNQKPRNHVFDGVFRTVDTVFSSLFIHGHRKASRSARPKR